MFGAILHLGFAVVKRVAEVGVIRDLLRRSAEGIAGIGETW
jgi:hypothetical protein